MLCPAPDEPIGRDHLGKFLWLGRFEAQARASLRQCLLDFGKLIAAAQRDLVQVSCSRISSMLNSSTDPYCDGLCEFETK